MAFISNGTTILDAGAFDVSLGSQILISEATASSSSSIEFTSGIDSTYDIYKWEFFDIHPSTDATPFSFNLSTDSGSNYNVTKTTTFFKAYHAEAGNDAVLTYDTNNDLAQSTGYQRLGDLGNDNDQNISGTLILFNPSSDTYVKHYIATTNCTQQSNYSENNFTAGYGNTTSVINAIDFKFFSGNIDAGTIKMYGIKGS